LKKKHLEERKNNIERLKIPLNQVTTAKDNDIEPELIQEKIILGHNSTASPKS
jgi:hypothetical protein